MSLNETPRANRLHIAIFGKRNSGKSSLINALTGQATALVSEHPGTTTDPVYKSMELYPIGPVVFIDTAGFDDIGDLGRLRVERTEEVIRKTDVAILVFDGTAPEDGLAPEQDWDRKLKDAKIPVIYAVNKGDLMGGGSGAFEARIQELFGAAPVVVSARDRAGIPSLRSLLSAAVPEDSRREKILQDLVQPGDVVLLVMPQDIQAPKGRLILPQVQTIRELLDSKTTVVCVTADGMDAALELLPTLPEEKLTDGIRQIPSLIITDSQCFDRVYRRKPPGTQLTSFSVLLAACKGDLDVLVEGAEALEKITPDSRVLIAEACTHAPLTEDIGREKIPNLLRRKLDKEFGPGSGERLRVEIVAGTDFPKDLSPYTLVIHCGSCMFNRKYMMSRLSQAQLQNVPITNYGVVLAYLTGILDKITLPR
jgi:[FeFe] hydrogenase H-cluster maturation GTPase HydF